MTAIADATDSSTVEKLITTVQELQETVEQQAEQIDQLETELAEHKDHTGREFADVRARITEVENQQTEPDSEDATPRVDGERTGSQNAETPLERICGLPEYVANQELTANQRRARAVAKDIDQYGETLRDGQRINTTRMRTVLSALSEDGERMYRTTVHRVMGFLEEFGEGEVEVRKQRNGQKMVYFPDEFVERLDRTDVCSGVNGETPLLVG